MYTYIYMILVKVIVYKTKQTVLTYFYMYI